GDVEPANDARADAANVEPADLRLAQEESIAQQHVGHARTAVGEALDEPGLAAQREDHPTAQRPVFGSVRGEPDVAVVSAEPGKIDTGRRGLSASRALVAVEVVVEQRETEDRTHPLADCLAQVAAR